MTKHRAAIAKRLISQKYAMTRKQLCFRYVLIKHVAYQFRGCFRSTER